MFANTKVAILSLALALTGVAAVPQQLSSIASVPTETLPTGASSAVPSASGSAPLSVPSISGSLPLSSGVPTASSNTLITNSITGSASGVVPPASSVPATSAAGTSGPATTVAVTTTSRPGSGSVAGSGTGTGSGTAAAATGTGTNNNGAMGRGASDLVAALGVLAGAGLAL